MHESEAAFSADVDERAEVIGQPSGRIHLETCPGRRAGTDGYGMLD